MRPRGFTLIEILIAVAILGIVLSTVYASYIGTFRLVSATQDDARIYAMARSTLDRMARDLQSVVPWGGAFTFRTRSYTLGRRDFVGLLFRSTAHVSFGEREVPEGIAVIEYAVEEEAEKEGYTLSRNDSLYRDPEKETPRSGGFLLCEGIESLTYRFLDEAGKEYDSWDSQEGSDAQRKRAPAGVVIRLNLVNAADKDRPYRFMTAVRLPMNRVEAQ